MSTLNKKGTRLFTQNLKQSTIKCWKDKDFSYYMQFTEKINTFSLL